MVDEATGISKFWFEVDEGDGSAVQTEDQNGLGFALQDSVMFANSSCQTTSATLGAIARIDVAVSSSTILASPSR